VNENCNANNILASDFSMGADVAQPLCSRLTGDKDSDSTITG